MKLFTLFLFCCLLFWLGIINAEGRFNNETGATMPADKAEEKQFLHININGSASKSLPPAKVLSIYSTACPSDNRPEFFVDINDGIIKIPVNCLPGSFLDRVVVLLEPPPGYYFWGHTKGSGQENGSKVAELKYTRETHVKELNIREKISFHMVFVDLTELSMGGLLRNLNYINTTLEEKKLPALFYVSNFKEPLFMFRDTNGKSSISGDRFFNTLSRLHSSPPIIDNDITKIDMLLKKYGLEASLEYLNLHIILSGKSLEQEIHTIERIFNYLEHQNKKSQTRVSILIEDATDIDILYEQFRNANVLDFQLLTIN